MKIIHCGDLHLGSSLSFLKDEQKIEERKRELLDRFFEMLKWARREHVSCILIAGDLFDTDKKEEKLVRDVLQMIENASEISFYYVNGNHDCISLPTLPNFHVFGDSEWECCMLNTSGSIRLYGRSLKEAASNQVHDEIKQPFDEINLPIDGINLMLLHGQVVNGNTYSVKRNEIPLGKLQNKNIDYLALGHIHQYKKWELDKRGVACYCGCLEGRGFDEQGKHGFVLLEINENTGIESTFLPFAKRTIYEITSPVDDGWKEGDGEVLVEQIRRQLDRVGATGEDYVRIYLVGRQDSGAESPAGFLERVLHSSYYYVQVIDQTGADEGGRIIQMNMDCQNMRIDRANQNTYPEQEKRFSDKSQAFSLKNEFLRLVYSDEALSEEEKRAVAEMGLTSLQGEKW